MSIVFGIRLSILIFFVLSVVNLSLQAQEIIITKERDLDFGMTFAGITQDFIIDLDDPGSAFFTLTGPRNTDIFISFVLPDQLVNNNGTGTIPLTFDDTSAGWSRRENQTPPDGNLFDPAIGTEATIHPGGGGQLGSSFVWLGGVITIDAQQPAGAYSGTATIIVEITGL